MKEQIIDELKVIHEICDIEDRSTEYMLQMMEDTGSIAQAAVAQEVPGQTSAEIVLAGVLQLVVPTTRMTHAYVLIQLIVTGLMAGLCNGRE